MAASVFRLAARRAPVFRARAAAAPMSSRFARTFSTTVPRFSGDHHEESFEEFTARYERTGSRGVCDANGRRPLHHNRIFKPALQTCH